MISFSELWDRIIGLLRRLFGREVRELDLTKKKPPRRWWQFPFRIIQTHRGGLNMPKLQRCPHCGTWAKRREKTRTGAIYPCRCKTTFSVAAPRRRVVKDSEKRKDPLFWTSGAIIRGRFRKSNAS